MNAQVIKYELTWAEPEANLSIRDPDVKISGIHAETREDAIF